MGTRRASRVCFNAAIAPLVALFVWGCSDSTSTYEYLPAVDVTGVWTGTARGNSGVSGNISASFTQDGKQLTGSVTVSSVCGPNRGEVSGSVSGTTLSAVITAPLVPTVRFMGTVKDNQIDGTYESDARGLCAADSGTFTLKR